MQIPLGIMLDRLSFRFVTFIAITMASIGTFAFVASDNWNFILFSRFLIGAGSGVAFLSVAKITKTYFPEKYHSLLLGFAFTFGLIGAVFGVTPMKMMFDYFGYNDTFTSLAIVGLSIAFLMLVLGKTEKTEQAKDNMLSQIINLVLDPKIILIGVSGGLMVGALEGFADVWAIPFFKQAYNMTDIESSIVTSFVYIGMCFGGPILAVAASMVRSTNFMIFITGILTVAIFIILFWFIKLSFVTSSVLMFFLGILCCYQVLVFAVVSSYVPESSAGLSIAITNCINMSFGHFFHIMIGRIIHNNWDGAVSELGRALYTRENFIESLAVIPICCFIGLFGFAYLAAKKK